MRLAPENHRSLGMAVQTLRLGVVERRGAAWRWQDRLGLPRTPTAYRERETHSRPYLRWLKRTWAKRAHKAYRRYVTIASDSASAICFVFGPYCRQALAVARCESGPSMTPRAHNGQYLGMFQMGAYARARYGHGPDRLTQARAAYAYFVDSGRDWSPWSCKP